MKRSGALQVRLEPALRDPIARLCAERHVNVSLDLCALIADAHDRELCRAADVVGTPIEVGDSKGFPWIATVTAAVEHSPGCIAATDSARPRKVAE